MKAVKKVIHFFRSDLCKWFLEAIKREGIDKLRCGWCGGLNLWYDDCGFFYLNPDGLKGEQKHACKKCWKGEVGDKHREKWGVGER